MKKVKVAIIGASGYTGQELIRILIHHPQVEIVCLLSEKLNNTRVDAYCVDLAGEADLEFTNVLSKNADVYFLCLPHGETALFLEKHHWLWEKKWIDLSRDFRLETSTTNEKKIVYGLTEMNKKNISQAQFIANPGCFATAIQLALLPLLSVEKLSYIHVNAITGSTGAGVKLSDSTHFSWRQNNMSVYQAFEHAHNNEILQTCKILQNGHQPEFTFVPIRGSFTRGILATIMTKTNKSIEEILDSYMQYYKESAFVFVSKKEVDLKMVVNTNKCFIHLQKKENNLLITSVLDNLLKGASGQAVQNMNLMFGLPETLGLKIKAITF